MCLTISNDETNKKILTSLKKRAKNGKVICWKGLSKCYRSKNYKSWWQNSLYVIGKTKQSTRKSVKINKTEIYDGEIYKGIHVFLNKEDVCEGIPVKVVCRLKDLVCCGTYNGTNLYNAVFTKVFVSTQSA